MTEDHTLRDELRECINDYALQWRHSRTSNATIAELAVMACVSSDGPLPLPDAVSWIWHHSHKFSSLVDKIMSKVSDMRSLSLVVSFAGGSDDMLNDNSKESIEALAKLLKKSHHWQESVRIALNDFKVPIYEVDDLGSLRWRSPISSANMFLRRRLFPCNTGTRRARFRIMDLPVEVREMIFEFALLLPRSGVWYDFEIHYDRSGERRRTLRAWTRDRDFTASQYLSNTWDTDKESPGASPKKLFQVDLKSHLALLRVSKQVHKEAFPCFYSKNVFYLPNDWAFMKLFQNMSDAQLRYLGRVVWRWTKTEPPSKKHVQQIAALPRLRTLVIDVKEEEDDQVDFMRNWNRDTGLLSDDVSHLTTIKGLQNVVLFGTIAKHEQFLRSQMVGWKSEVDLEDVAV